MIVYGRFGKPFTTAERTPKSTILGSHSTELVLAIGSARGSTRTKILAKSTILVTTKMRRRHCSLSSTQTNRRNGTCASRPGVSTLQGCLAIHKTFFRRYADISRTNEVPQTFNYYYDEVDGLESFPISDADAAKLTNTIKGLYGSAASIIEQSIANAGKTGVDDNAGETLLKQVAALQKISAGEIDPTFESLKTTDFIKEGFDLNTLLKDSTEAQRRIRDIVTDGNYLEWILNIKGQRHAFDGNYQVTVFLDKVPDPDVEAPQMWPFNPNFVGNFSPLGQKPNTSCGRCQDQQTNNVEVTGQIPLTIALIERYLAGTLDKFDDQTTVEAYLTKNLHWRVLAV